MKRTASSLERIVSVVAAVLFLWAAGPDAYGARPCPHHGADEAAEASPSEPHEHPGPGAASAGTETSHHHGSEGPCTCVDTCHASSAVAVTFRAPPDPVGGVPAFRVLPTPDGDDLMWGARHSAYELHLPNAPPASS